jgi:type II secretory pathway component PulJ
MDWTHILLLTSGIVQIVGLIIFGVVLTVGYTTLRQVEESNQRIAEMANRNERMTQSILQKVYDMQTRQ